MVDEYTPWIAGTQRLQPACVRVVPLEEGADIFVLEVPKRNVIWYLVFACVIWGIPLTIALVFLMVANQSLVRILVPVGCVFVATMLSIERKFVFSGGSQRVTISHRVGPFNLCIFEKKIMLAFERKVEAVKARDIEGLRQVEISIFEGSRRFESLLVFSGWHALPAAQVLAQRLNSLMRL